MFVRTKLNSSGSTSVQIISKARGRYKVVRSFGSATTQQEIDSLVQKARQEINHLSKPQDLFRHLVISRIAFPLSKLKTIDYLFRYQGVSLEIDTVYRCH